MEISLESFDAERADFEKMLAAIRAIAGASEAQLHDLDWLLGLIRRVGLVPIATAARDYADEFEHVNSSQQGLIQIPREFAKLLLLLGEHRIDSFLEIGTFTGGTACLAAAYLARLNPGLRAVTLDVAPLFIFHHLVRGLIPLRYEVGRTSFDFRAERFDAVLIDGDHVFDWVWADYLNVGQAAKICALHDVNHAEYLEIQGGGVPAVWELMKREEPGAEFVEIFEHPTDEVMGIGVRVRREN